MQEEGKQEADMQEADMQEVDMQEADMEADMPGRSGGSVEWRLVHRPGDWGGRQATSQRVGSVAAIQPAQRGPFDYFVVSHVRETRWACRAHIPRFYPRIHTTTSLSTGRSSTISAVVVEVDCAGCLWLAERRSGVVP